MGQKQKQDREKRNKGRNVGNVDNTVWTFQMKNVLFPPGLLSTPFGHVHVQQPFAWLSRVTWQQMFGFIWGVVNVSFRNVKDKGRGGVGREGGCMIGLIAQFIFLTDH